MKWIIFFSLFSSISLLAQDTKTYGPYIPGSVSYVNFPESQVLYIKSRELRYSDKYQTVERFCEGEDKAYYLRIELKLLTHLGPITGYRRMKINPEKDSEDYIQQKKQEFMKLYKAFESNEIFLVNRLDERLKIEVYHRGNTFYLNINPPPL